MFDGAFSEDHGCKTQRFSGCICDYEHQKDSTWKSQCLLKAYLTEINYALDFLRADNLSPKRKLLLPFLLAPVLPQAHCWRMSGHPGICWVQPHMSAFLPLCIIYLFLFLNDLLRAERVIGSLLPPRWSQGSKPFTLSASLLTSFSKVPLWEVAGASTFLWKGSALSTLLTVCQHVLCAPDSSLGIGFLVSV